MNRTNGTLAHRAGPIVAGVALVASVALAFLPPAVPAVAALDPAAPAASADPSVEPPASPDPDPAPDASVDPGPLSSPGESPSPVPSPSPTPRPADVVDADGGAVVSAGVTLEFPAGTVRDPTQVQVSPVAGLPDFDGSAPVGGISIAAWHVADGTPVDTFGGVVALTVATDGYDLADVEPANLRIALLVDGSWTVLDTTAAPGTLSAAIVQTGLYGIVEQALADAVPVALDQSSDAPSAGRHRVEPGAEVQITITATAASKLYAGRLIETVPGGWTILDANGGTVDATAGTITWSLRSVRAGTTLRHAVRLIAPDLPAPDGSAFVSSLFATRLEQAAGTTNGPDLEILVAPALGIDHASLSQVDRRTLTATDLAVDAPIIGEQRFEVFRIRFSIFNVDSVPVRWTPQLEYRAATAAAYARVPAGDPVAGVPFYASHEWVRGANATDGTVESGDSEEVPRSAVSPGDPPVQGASAAPGEHSMGLNPARAMTVPGRSYTVVEFSVRATVDAEYQSAYVFRVTDLGQPMDVPATAFVRMGPRPPLDLSPGQLPGIPGDAGGANVGMAYPLMAAAASPATGPRFPLLARAVPPVSSGAVVALGLFPSPHGPSSGTGDACGACHRTHSAQGANLLAGAPPQGTRCFACHDGTGSDSNVAAQYASASLSPNDEANREYYSHPALAPDSGHTSSDTNEFQDAAGQPVLNRHSECADCHDPHKAIGTDSVETPAGWTASGRLADISGVTVTNGAAGAAPAYGWSTAVTLQYELCFKCHSGFTTQLSNDPAHPSRDSLDKGVEFNPANLSYHPVEAAGRNASVAMANSLAGTSPFKQWTFTPSSVIRCEQCHGDPAKFSPASPPAAGSDLSTHASPNRGLLMQPYRDRVLTSSADSYDPSNFALCYLCHGEAPFVDSSGGDRPDTDFSFHGMHTQEIAGPGAPGIDIDALGQGNGDAICAECHFRVHSTAFPTGGQLPALRGVNFAPNVANAAGDGVVGPNAWTGPVGRSCTLTCHGERHNHYTY